MLFSSTMSPQFRAERYLFIYIYIYISHAIHVWFMHLQIYHRNVHHSWIGKYASFMDPSWVYLPDIPWKSIASCLSQTRWKLNKRLFGTQCLLPGQCSRTPSTRCAACSTGWNRQSGRKFRVPQNNNQSWPLLVVSRVSHNSTYIGVHKP